MRSSKGWGGLDAAPVEPPAARTRLGVGVHAGTLSHPFLQVMAPSGVQSIDSMDSKSLWTSQIVSCRAVNGGHRTLVAQPRSSNLRITQAEGSTIPRHAPCRAHEG